MDKVQGRERDGEIVTAAAKQLRVATLAPGTSQLSCKASSGQKRGVEPAEFRLRLKMHFREPIACRSELFSETGRADLSADNNLLRECKGGRSYDHDKV